MNNKYIDIAVVFDDHQLFNEAFSTLLERLDIFRVVLSLKKEEEIINLLLEKKKDAVVYFFLDYYIPGVNTLSLLKNIRSFSKVAKIIIVSSISSAPLLNDLLFYKPDGILSKSLGMEDVIFCIKTIEKGAQYISPGIEIFLKESSSNEIHFTPREQELLRFFADGNNVEDTAKAFNLSRHTVIAHRRSMMNKTNTGSIIELLAFAKAANILE